MKNLIDRFFTFANRSYTMFAAKSNMKDGRKKPQISPSVIFLSLILMVLLKRLSLLKLDQLMRTPAARRSIVDSHRPLTSQGRHVILPDEVNSSTVYTFYQGG